MVAETIRLPVCLTLFKHNTGGLIVKWVTISESLLLYAFDSFCAVAHSAPTTTIERPCSWHEGSQVINALFGPIHCSRSIHKLWRVSHRLTFRYCTVRRHPTQYPEMDGVTNLSACTRAISTVKHTQCFTQQLTPFQLFRHNLGRAPPHDLYDSYPYAITLPCTSHGTNKYTPPHPPFTCL